MVEDRLSGDRVDVAPVLRPGTPSSTLGAVTDGVGYDALALIPTDRAAFSYHSQDLKFVCRALRRCFRLDLEREPIDFLSTFRDTCRFKFVS
jgi:hypothetical protein